MAWEERRRGGEWGGIEKQGHDWGGREGLDRAVKEGRGGTARKKRIGSRREGGKERVEAGREEWCGPGKGGRDGVEREGLSET